MLARISNNSASHKSLVDMKKGIDTKENILAVPYKVEHTITLHPEMLSTVSMSIYSNEIKTCLYKNLLTNVHSNFICQKLQATYKSLIWKMVNQIVLNLLKGLLLKNKKE